MKPEMAANVAAYEHTVRATIALAEDFTADDWKTPTECPGWSVQDVVAHLATVELLLLGEDPGRGHEMGPMPAHVRSDFGAMLEVGIDARRGWAGPDVAAELGVALERRLAALPGLDPDEMTTAPTGEPVPYWHFMTFRAFDCWAHEQDIRRAIGRPGNLDSPGADCARRLLRPALPRVVGKRAATGQTVVFDVGDPVPFRSRIRVGDDGRAAEVEAGDDATATLTMGWEVFLRLAAGRCAPGEVEVAVEGDGDLAGRVLANMAVTP
ncbi:maleylpyruvate isomerase family mycothiol-dependent enzyme [Spirillospora sp. CA-294931]|uniref:maleylpyruvate isomerase family mycothiol-dependent enzyme n=1 Tax=Spirillospora sp. CA-294931 TaxID=3240042 RepID=UPI003D8A257A